MSGFNFATANGTVINWRNYGIIQDAKEGELIDCNDKPRIPRSFCLIAKDQPSNAITGLVAFNPECVEFNLSNYRRKGGNVVMVRGDIRPLHTAHVLDYLLRRPYLIPKEWRRRKVYFSGTVYRLNGRQGWIRYLDYSTSYGEGIDQIANGDVLPKGGLRFPY